MFRTREGKWAFSGKNTRFVTDPDLIRCLKYIKYWRLLLTCAPISELPSDVRTMLKHLYNSGLTGLLNNHT